MISKWLLAVIASGVLLLQLLLWHQLSFDQFRLNVLCSAVLVYLVLSKRTKLTWESGPLATVLGGLLLLFFLLKCNASPGRLFTSLAPLLWGFGLALLASGFKGLKQYRQELIVFACITLPFALRWVVIDTAAVHLAPTTAKAAVAVVDALGWHATVNYQIVHLPTGELSVEEGCCGLKSMFFAFGLSVVLLLILPPSKRIFDLIAPLGALMIAFLVNVVRVAFLITLVNASKQEAFHYWHEGRGSAVFDIAPVLFFLAFYRYVVMRTETAKPISQPEVSA